MSVRAASPGAGGCRPHLLWITDEHSPRELTLRIAEALQPLEGLALMFRDKRASPDWRLAEALCALGRPVWLNAAGAEARWAELGALGFHAPEAWWRARQEAPTPPAGLLCLSDHDGAGQRQAQRWQLPCVLVSPLFLDKGRPARGAPAWVSELDAAAPRAAAERSWRLGLGGVDSAARAATAVGFGCDGVAVQRALYLHPAPAQQAQALIAAVTTPAGR